MGKAKDTSKNVFSYRKITIFCLLLNFYFTVLNPKLSLAQDNIETRRVSAKQTAQQFENVLIDLRGSRGGRGDVAAGYLNGISFLNDLEFNGNITFLVDQTSQRILKTMTNQEIKDGATLFQGRIKVKLLKSLNDSKPYDLYINLAKPSGRESAAADMIADESIKKFKLSKKGKILIDENTVRVYQTVLGNTENSNSVSDKGLIAIGNDAYSMEPPGLGKAETGIYLDPEALSLRGKSEEELSLYVTDQIKQLKNETLKKNIQELWMTKISQKQSDHTLVYGVTHESVHKQFEAYLYSLSHEVEFNKKSAVILTPSGFNLKQIENTSLRKRIQVIDASKAEAFELIRAIDSSSEKFIYIVKTGGIPHPLFNGLLASSKLTPIIAGDGALSAAVTIGKPFAMTKIAWNEKNASNLASKLKNILNENPSKISKKFILSLEGSDLRYSFEVDQHVLQAFHDLLPNTDFFHHKLMDSIRLAKEGLLPASKMQSQYKLFLKTPDPKSVTINQAARELDASLSETEEAKLIKYISNGLYEKIDPHHKLTPEIWKRVRLGLESANPEMRSISYFFLNSRKSIPKEGWLELMKSIQAMDYNFYLIMAVDNVERIPLEIKSIFLRNFKNKKQFNSIPVEKNIFNSIEKKQLEKYATEAGLGKYCFKNFLNRSLSTRDAAIGLISGTLSLTTLIGVSGVMAIDHYIISSERKFIQDSEKVYAKQGISPLTYFAYMPKSKESYLIFYSCSENKLLRMVQPPRPDAYSRISKSTDDIKAIGVIGIKMDFDLENSLDLEEKVIKPRSTADCKQRYPDLEVTLDTFTDDMKSKTQALKKEIEDKELTYKKGSLKPITYLAHMPQSKVSYLIYYSCTNRKWLQAVPPNNLFQLVEKNRSETVKNLGLVDIEDDINGFLPTDSFVETINREKIEPRAAADCKQRYPDWEETQPTDQDGTYLAEVVSQVLNYHRAYTSADLKPVFYYVIQDGLFYWGYASCLQERGLQTSDNPLSIDDYQGQLKMFNELLSKNLPPNSIDLSNKDVDLFHGKGINYRFQNLINSRLKKDCKNLTHSKL